MSSRVESFDRRIPTFTRRDTLLSIGAIPLALAVAACNQPAEAYIEELKEVNDRSIPYYVYEALIKGNRVSPNDRLWGFVRAGIQYHPQDNPALRLPEDRFRIPRIRIGQTRENARDIPTDILITVTSKETSDRISEKLRQDAIALQNGTGGFTGLTLEEMNAWGVRITDQRTITPE